jgi:hypothetical protein
MLDNKLDQGDILSGVRFGLALLAYADILLGSIWAIHRIRQTPVTIYFTHMTVKIVGKGLEALAEGLRRQVIPYIQEQHKSEFEARDEAYYVQSIKVGPPAEELGSWAG